MSKGSAIVSILIAFVGGIAIGNLMGTKGEGDELATDGDGAAVAAAPDDGVERFRVDVGRDQPVKGADDALVTIVEFSDFECPFCSRVGPTITRIMNEYRGKVRVAWRNNPLPFHDNAMPAAMASIEAFVQGGSEKFWRMHDKLFENQRALTRPDLERYATELGLDMTRFRQALDNSTHRARIQADQNLAQQADAGGTPAFFINGRKLSGAQPFEQFKTVIDDEVRRAEALVKSGTPRNRIYAALMKNASTKAGAAPAREPGKQPPRRQPDPNAVYRVPIGNDPSRGNRNALVTIAMFSDFECPFCGRVEPTMNQILETYGQDVRVVWMNNPLPFHRNAGPAAQASLEVFAQAGADKFWAFHAKLFEHQRELTRENLVTWATELGGINTSRLNQALDTNSHQADIDRTSQLARSLGATGTPAFFINGRNLRGAQPFEAFKTVIDQELEKARAKLRELGGDRARGRLYDELTKNGATEAQFLAPPPGGDAPPGGPPGGGPPGGPPEADRVYNIAVPPNAPFKGGRNARVVIQEFSDFQCPFCSRVEPTVSQIVQEYGDRVKIVWRNFPLPFHQNAMPAAQATVEVYRQGGADKFWAFHAKLFQNQQALSRADLERYAQEVGGINMGEFRQALDTNRHQAAVQADMDAVTQAGAQIGTPSFFINGRLLQGAQPFPEFKAAIDRALAAP